MCNIDCVPKTWSLSLKDYARLDDFCKDNSITEDDFAWLMEFCKKESLDFKNLCNLFDFYDIYKRDCYLDFNNKKNEVKENLYLKFSDKEFIISSRIKSFLRVIKKIVKKNNEVMDGNKLSWNDITSSFDSFEDAIYKYVRDFCGCRVIPVPSSTQFSIENLNYTLKTISPQDFLLKLFIPTTDYYKSFDNNLLYSLKDFFTDKYSVCNYKDFLKYPKSNGYRSLQFGCFLDDGRRVEVQIRNFLHHIYAEYEHRRYEAKLQFSEFIPFYLSCEICSNYFKNDKLKDFDFSKMAFLYFTCLSVLTNDDLQINELNSEISCYACVNNCNGSFCFNDSLCNFDDQFIQTCSYIILSVRNSIIKDSCRYCTPIRNQIILEMDMLDDASINERIMNIFDKINNTDSHRLSYKIKL